MTPVEADRDCLAIRNLHAGQKAGVRTSGKSLAELHELFSRHGLNPPIVETQTEEEAVGAVRDAIQRGCRTIIAIGGDGTAATVAREIAGTNAALGMLPLGSFMNLPRSLGIPHDLEEAAEVLAHGRRHAIDVGEARGRLFLEAASVGLNAALLGEAHKFDKGRYRSLFGIVWTLLRYRPARFAVHVDEGIARTRALMIVIANGPYTGANLTFAPEARLDDGYFDVRVYRHFSKWETVRHLASIMLGRRGYSFKVSTYRSRRVRVEGASPRPCRADDFDLGSTPIECLVRPRALTVIVPSGYRSPALSS